MQRLEILLDGFNATLAPLKEFILPGGTGRRASRILPAPSARRAERRTVTLSRGEALSPFAIQYLNRLSDLLFVLARTLNRAGDRDDVLWQPGK